MSISIVKNSDPLKRDPYNNDPIYLCMQFFIHGNPERHKETLYCLKMNVKLGLFKQVILLNERIYTKEELGLNDSEMKCVMQLSVKKRLTYSTAFKRIKKLNLQGYFVLSNSDIFFDKTIDNLRKTCLDQKKSMYTLLRFEYLKQKRLGYCKLFNHPKTNAPRPDSQDVWIYHSNYHPVDEGLLEQCNFHFGKPGCDNKITYIMTTHGYTCINEPWNVKTYHYHMTQIRNYTRNDVLPPPYLFVEPVAIF